MSGLSERLNELHAHLLEGSRTASLDLFREAREPVRSWIRGKFPSFSWEDAGDIATDAIVFHIQHATAFDPSKSSLLTYLGMIAERDAIDALRERTNRARLMGMWKKEIELWQVDTNKDSEEVEWKRDAGRIMQDHGSKIVKTEQEKRVLELILDGERSVAAYAEILGLASDDGAEDEVKRVKDRITLRMKKVRDELE